MVQFQKNITKRKGGRFMGRFTIGNNENGKPVYQYVHSKTYEEAEKKLMIGLEIESQYLAGNSISVREVYAEWLNATAHRVKVSTLSNYRMKVEKHILPMLGDKPCSMLTAVIINDFISKKLAEGLSASYVRDIVVVLKTMLHYAQEEYHFILPLGNVAMPKCEKKQTEKLSESEKNALVSYLRQNMDLTAFGILISLYMGLRIGELCGLQWGDVDFERHVLHIRRTVQRISAPEGKRKTQVIVSSPKSQTSRRSIPIPDCLMAYFRQFRADDACWLLSGTDKLIEPRTMQYRYKKILAKAGASGHTYHQLRHTFATNCVESGFDVKTLSILLGHSSASLTLNRYVHPDFAHEQRLMNSLRM